MGLEVLDVVLGDGVAIKRFDGTVIVTADNEVTADIQATAKSIDTAEIADGAIETLQINDSAVTTEKIANQAITTTKFVDAQSATATGDGTGTGAIIAPTGFRKFVTATSANATNQLSLPGINAGTVGQEVWITVGANGYELVTPASSNNTINQVDADGTNQLDVAANTTVRCTQVSASAWIAETIAATSIAITAPDND